MPIYTPQQALPQRNFSKVWNAITTYVTKPGSELSRFVKTFQLGLGRDVDGIDPTAWAADMMPLIRLDLVGGPAQPFNQATTKSMVGVNVTVAIVGTNTGSLTDFWECFVDHIHPVDDSLYQLLKPLQVMHYSIGSPAFTPTIYSDTKGMTATGQIRLNYEFKTRI